MDRSTRLTLIATCLAGGFGLATFAATAQQAVAADAQVRTDAAQADAALATQDPTAAQSAQKNAGCLKETGSRIRARDPRTGKLVCQGQGRAYSRDDINRTGQTDLADALRRLDPSVR